MPRLGAMSNMLAARAVELSDGVETPAPKLVAVQAEEETPVLPEAAVPDVAAAKTEVAAAAHEAAGDEDELQDAADNEEGTSQEDDPAPAATAVTPEPKPERKPKAAATRRKPKSQAPVVPAPPAEPGGRAHYTELIRKELRLHPGQSADLTVLTVTLHNAKRGRGERITDNTIMRIALDLLLERKHELKGTTEDELRASVGLPPVVYED